ncbi:DUF3558 family protein [Gordonia sp. CPCC 205333]|uniref:DUF3558 family protein n=1 Tax=Gordonia sp. CPCC 205333 TaxID=3140790 RepID=UPI003AF3FE28
MNPPSRLLTATLALTCTIGLLGTAGCANADPDRPPTSGGNPSTTTPSTSDTSKDNAFSNWNPCAISQKAIAAVGLSGVQPKRANYAQLCTWDGHARSAIVRAIGAPPHEALQQGYSSGPSTEVTVGGRRCLLATNDERGQIVAWWILIPTRQHNTVVAAINFPSSQSSKNVNGLVLAKSFATLVIPSIPE